MIRKDPKSAEIIKPILRGRDIRAYRANWREEWLIATFPSSDIEIDNYPAIKEWLQIFLPKINQSGEGITQTEKNELEKRLFSRNITYREADLNKCRKKTTNKWFELQDNCAYHADFEKEKIIYSNMTKYLPFAFDKGELYANAKCYIVTGNNLKYLISILNSPIVKYWIKQNLPTLQGGTRELRKVSMVDLPVPRIIQSERQTFINLTDSIIDKKQKSQDTLKDEQQLASMVCELYGLTPEEILLVEKAT